MLQPMQTFDPTKPCKVHDRLNDCLFDWKPDWAEDYRKHGFVFERGRGVMSWDGLLLDGWMEVDENSAETR